MCADRGIAVYCGSSPEIITISPMMPVAVGRAIAQANRTLVYGGGSKGIMGVVSGTALDNGGKVIGVTPSVMVAQGGEGEKADVQINEAGREKVEVILVQSMHERKVEMAKRVEGFIGLPGGFGTFEEVLEVTTWTQLGIHDKPVVLINVLSFWEPLRQLIKSGVRSGFIKQNYERIVVFVDGPKSHDEHTSFDWGKGAIEAIDNWQRGMDGLYDWTGKSRDPKFLDNRT